jgi:hypothetical protein
MKSIAAAFAGGLFFLASTAHADPTLKSALDLSMEQARQVDEIQRQARDAVRPVRTELYREQRALRRAHLANDREAVVRQEALIEPLRLKLVGIYENETRQIRAVLTSEQNVKYDAWLKKRDAEVGNVRGVREFQEKPAETRS